MMRKGLLLFFDRVRRTQTTMLLSYVIQTETVSKEDTLRHINELQCHVLGLEEVMTMLAPHANSFPHTRRAIQRLEQVFTRERHEYLRATNQKQASISSFLVSPRQTRSARRRELDDHAARCSHPLKMRTVAGSVRLCCMEDHGGRAGLGL